MKARLEDAAAKLGQHPTGRPSRIQGLFEKSVTRTSHIILYDIRQGTIGILRLVHTAREWRPGEWPV